MTKKLLATTALSVAGAMFAAGSANAAEQIKLGLGGYFNAFIVAASQDDGVGQPAANLRSHKIAREGEIHFTGETTLDNGITFGVNVQLEAETCVDQIDESYMYVEGSFGRLVVGSEDPATDAMFYGAPAIIAGVGLDTPDDTFSAIANGVTPFSIVNISGDSEKLTYFTPRFAGFQLGLSYTPDNCEENGGGTAACGGSYGGFQADNTAGQQSEIVEIAANYVGSFSGVDLNLYAGYSKGNLEVAAAGAEDQDMWGIGAQVGFAGFLIGGSYKQDDQGTSGNNTDRTDYALGVSYTTGPWTVGAAWAHAEVEVAAGGEDTTDGYQFGGQYALGPGITLTGGVTYWDIEDNANARINENESIEFIVGTTISF